MNMNMWGQPTGSRLKGALVGGPEARVISSNCVPAG
jgi:hypothetical protein